MAGKSLKALAANDLAKNFPIKAADLGTDLPTPTMVDRAGPNGGLPH
ncbi:MULTISPECIES: hypothetical protein [unclassified Mesorhizobium]|nr:MULTISPECIES: hypothetical protein [unclassified Mesorhizobium]